MYVCLLKRGSKEDGFLYIAADTNNLWTVEYRQGEPNLIGDTLLICAASPGVSPSDTWLLTEQSHEASWRVSFAKHLARLS